MGGIIAILCCVLAVTAAFYVLRSIGLYALAKNNGIDHAFVAWIPFAWIYVACKLISETRMFGWSFKNIAVWALIIFSVSGVLDIVYNVLTYFPAVGYFLQGGTITIVEENAGMKLYRERLFRDKNFPHGYKRYDKHIVFVHSRGNCVCVYRTFQKVLAAALYNSFCVIGARSVPDIRVCGEKQTCNKLRRLYPLALLLRRDLRTESAPRNGTPARTPV